MRPCFLSLAEHCLLQSISRAELPRTRPGSCRFSPFPATEAGDQWSPRQKYGRPADFVPSSKQLHNRHRKPGNAPKPKNGVMPGEPSITPLYHTAGRSAPTAPPEGKSGISFSEDCRFRSSRFSSRDAPRGAFRRRSPRHGRCPPSGSRRPPRGGSPNRRVSRG